MFTYWLGPKPAPENDFWIANARFIYEKVRTSLDGTQMLLSWRFQDKPTGLPSGGRFYGEALEIVGSVFALQKILEGPDWNDLVIETAVEGYVPKALRYGAGNADPGTLLAWANLGGSSPNAVPRLAEVIEFSPEGLVKREAFYEVSDVSYGWVTAPLPNTKPVYEIVYSSWTYGVMPGSNATLGIIERGPRTIRFYGEDNSVVYELIDSAKQYSYDRALEASRRRRDNMINQICTTIILGVLLAVYPEEDPGARAGLFLNTIQAAVDLYIASGEGIGAALTSVDTNEFDWLLTEVVPGVALQAYLIGVLQPPPNGVIVV